MAGLDPTAVAPALPAPSTQKCFPLHIYPHAEREGWKTFSLNPSQRDKSAPPSAPRGGLAVDLSLWVSLDLLSLRSAGHLWIRFLLIFYCSQLSQSSDTLPRV